MSSTRKKISIHDYPEHLNPFSEQPTVPLSKTGKVFVDRLNMSGTWSSKITKRVNRSVTWIEKSWLGIEDSKKYKIQSAKTGTSNVKSNHADSLKSIIRDESRPTQLADSNSSEKRADSDYQQVRERIRETIVNPNEMISPANCDEEKKEIKKKKKRPAPQPPLAAADSCTPPPENSHSAPVCNTSTSEKNEELENSTTNASTVENHFISSHTPVEKSYSTSCESENADSGVDSRPLSNSSVYELSSPSKSENEDSDGQGESIVIISNSGSRTDECGAVPTISRPNRPSRNKEDGEAKLSPDQNASAKEAEEEPRSTSDERLTSQHGNNAKDDHYGDDEVFVNVTIPVPIDECELDGNGNVPDVPLSCETESGENGSRKMDNQNGGKAIQV